MVSSALAAPSRMACPNCAIRSPVASLNSPAFSPMVWTALRADSCNAWPECANLSVRPGPPDEEGAGGVVPVAGSDDSGIPEGSVPEGGDVGLTGGGMVEPVSGEAGGTEGSGAGVGAGAGAGGVVSTGGVAGAGVTCSVGASAGWSASSEQAASRPSEATARVKAVDVRRISITSSLLCLRTRKRRAARDRYGTAVTTSPALILSSRTGVSAWLCKSTLQHPFRVASRYNPGTLRVSLLHVAAQKRHALFPRPAPHRYACLEYSTTLVHIAPKKDALTGKKLARVLRFRR